jgi:UDP-N-acetylmuramyl pentapeptide phosphotransferase/UDP-N-acetylglucosamine-1-phosphate transferase
VSVAGLALVAFAVTLALTPLAMVVATRTGIMDRPGELKEQTRPVPYLGGVAVLAGVLVAVLTDQPSLAVPLVAATALGVADDRFDLPPAVRIVGELAVGAAVVVTCPVHLPGVVAAVAIVAVTLLLVNGVNLLDGLDMLAGGTVAVAAVGFAVLLLGTGRQLGVALAAALVAFLVFNRPPARIYLGDGGSYLLGTALAVLVAQAWDPIYSDTVGYASFALVALPAAEVAFAVVRRLRGRRSVLAGDRGHPYDRLVARGWSRPSASTAYIAAQGILTVGAVFAVRQSSPTLAVVVDCVGGAALVVAAGLVGSLSPDQEVAP